MLVLVIPQADSFRVFLFLISNFIFCLVLLRLFSDKLGFWNSQEIQDLLACHFPGRSWSWSGHWQLPVTEARECLTIIRKCKEKVSSLFTSSVQHNLAQVCLTGWTLPDEVLSFSFKNSNVNMKVGIIVAIN